MPELPELVVYRERLEEALRGRTVARVTVHDPFVLRTVEPSPEAAVGSTVAGVSRRSKFLLLDLDPSLHLVFHLMLGGRLHLKRADRFKPHRKRTRFSTELDDGTVLEMTEAGTKRRASLHVLRDPADLDRVDRGVEPLDGDLTPERLAALLRGRNRQVKTALRDPSLLSGIGNAYSDEILFAARLSPMRLTGRLTDEEIARLAGAIRDTLESWIARVRETCPTGLPVRQSLWREAMAVHGRAGAPCPRCGAVVCRVSFKESETCYCPDCQNEGRLLADRRLSRLGIRRRGA